MPVKFVTFSTDSDKTTKKIVKRFQKIYKEEIRMLVYEKGSGDDHYHCHALVDMTPTDSVHTARVAKKCQIPSDQVYGIRMDTVKDHKMEFYYVGYMQKEMKHRDPSRPGVFEDRTYQCIYGSRYLDKAWKHYIENKGTHKRTVKDSYDGTMLARKVLQTTSLVLKDIDDYYEALIDYTDERGIDVKNPDKMVGIMMTLKRMEKRKNNRVKNM